MGASSVSDFNNHKLSEYETITKFLSGQKELFKILLRRNNQKLYRAIRSYIKDEHEIEGLTQNAHIKTYEKLNQFRFSSSYVTWLIRKVINESLARLKEKQKMYTHPEGFQGVNRNLVLEMREIEELSTNETAECLGITIANVKVRNHSAKSILKDKLFDLTKNTSIYEFGFSRCDRITENVMI